MTPVVMATKFDTKRL